MKLLCIAGLAFGVALLYWGGDLPGWLLKAEIMTFSCAALAWGFISYSPRVPAWVMSNPIRGTIFVHLGIFAMFVPPQFIVSAWFIGAGTRLLMAEFTPKLSLQRQPGDLVARGSGPLRREI